MPGLRALLGGSRVQLGGAEIRLGDGELTVTLHTGRTQRILIDHRAEGLRLRSRCLTRARREELDEAARVRLDEELLERNRDVPFVTFGISQKGHVEAWVEPSSSSLDGDTLRFLVVWLAEEADRLELQLTGRDAY